MIMRQNMLTFYPRTIRIESGRHPSDLYKRGDYFGINNFESSEKTY